MFSRQVLTRALFKTPSKELFISGFCRQPPQISRRTTNSLQQSRKAPQFSTQIPWRSDWWWPIHGWEELFDPADWDRDPCLRMKRERQKKTLHYQRHLGLFEGLSYPRMGLIHFLGAEDSGLMHMLVSEEWDERFGNAFILRVENEEKKRPLQQFSTLIGRKGWRFWMTVEESLRFRYIHSYVHKGKILLMLHFEAPSSAWAHYPPLSSGRTHMPSKS